MEEQFVWCTRWWAHEDGLSSPFPALTSPKGIDSQKAEPSEKSEKEVHVSFFPRRERLKECIMLNAQRLIMKRSSSSGQG